VPERRRRLGVVRGTSPALDEALQFCRVLHEDLKPTRPFCAALDAAGLLVPHQA
jgi:hypothetical protein